eukprot:COSAG06_NODE_13635_length_1236_cov_6.905013_2_plen_166_part_00
MSATACAGEPALSSSDTTLRRLQKGEHGRGKVSGPFRHQLEVRGCLGPSKLQRSPRQFPVTDNTGHQDTGSRQARDVGGATGAGARATVGRSVSAYSVRCAGGSGTNVEPMPLRIRAPLSCAMPFSEGVHGRAGAGKTKPLAGTFFAEVSGPAQGGVCCCARSLI